MARLTRAILVRCGLVEGYDHKCRTCKRRGTPVVERHDDPEQRLCPRCGSKMWVSAIPKAMRFHDTRHTLGTLLAKAAFDGVRLQRTMRHRDFKMTARYVHTNVDDLRAAAALLAAATLPGAADTAEPSASVPPAGAEALVTPLLQPPAEAKKEGPARSGKALEEPAPDSAPLEDLNPQ